MTHCKIFKIKKGKRKTWEKWCQEISSRQKEALETLEEENLVQEKCIIFGEGDNSYVFYRHETIPGKEKKPMNLTRTINQKHEQMMKECLEEVEDKITGYDIKIK